MLALLGGLAVYVTQVTMHSIPGEEASTLIVLHANDVVYNVNDKNN